MNRQTAPALRQRGLFGARRSRERQNVTDRDALIASALCKRRGPLSGYASTRFDPHSLQRMLTPAL
jgi:hypothetical protein